MSDRRSRDGFRRREGDRRRGGDSNGRPVQQTPIILDRRERATEPAISAKNESSTASSSMRDSQQTGENLQSGNVFEGAVEGAGSIPFMRRSNKFNSEAVVKLLLDHPGHFVIGIIGKQGVGKSTILSHFAEDPETVFATQQSDQFLQNGHKTEGINMHITSERIILLDTEPIQSWTVMEKALSNGSFSSNSSLPLDVWLEMEALYQIIFMMSICNVLLIVTEGPEIDLDILRLVQRAEMLKFHIPDFPLLINNQQDLNYFPEIVFVCNKVPAADYTWRMCKNLHLSIKSYFQESSVKLQGLVSLSRALPYYKMNGLEEMNLFLLPVREEEVIESFDFLIAALRDQVFAAPRRPGKKGQLSEKDWYRNVLKINEIVHKSDYINDYRSVLCRIRDV